MENDGTTIQTPLDACIYETPEIQFAQAGISLSGNVDYSVCTVGETVSLNSKAYETATSALRVIFTEDFSASIVDICDNAFTDIAGINLAYCESQLPSNFNITVEGGGNEPYTTGFTVPIESIDGLPHVILDHGPYWGFLNNRRPEGIEEFLKIPLEDFVRAVESATVTMDEAHMRDVIGSQLVDPMPPEAQDYMQTANTTAAGVGMSLILVVIATSFIPYVLGRAKDSAVGAWKSFRSGKGE